MNSKITFFPVDNGDMTLLQLADDRQTCLLIDCRIRRSADDPSDTTPDVAYELRKRIKNDARGRPFVDAMLLSHPDEDHCLGLRAHFWLGGLECLTIYWFTGWNSSLHVRILCSTSGSWSWRAVKF